MLEKVLLEGSQFLLRKPLPYVKRRRIVGLGQGTKNRKW